MEPSDRINRLAAYISATPITIEQLAENAGMSVEETKTFFDDKFGGFDAYVELCKDTKALAKRIAQLNMGE